MKKASTSVIESLSKPGWTASSRFSPSITSTKDASGERRRTARGSVIEQPPEQCDREPVLDPGHQLEAAGHREREREPGVAVPVERSAQVHGHTVGPQGPVGDRSQ